MFLFFEKVIVLHRLIGKFLKRDKLMAQYCTCQKCSVTYNWN